VFRGGRAAEDFHHHGFGDPHGLLGLERLPESSVHSGAGITE
jgi:hypothetical protein